MLWYTYFNAPVLVFPSALVNWNANIEINATAVVATDVIIDNFSFLATTNKIPATSININMYHIAMTLIFIKPNEYALGV